MKIHINVVLFVSIMLFASSCNFDYDKVVNKKKVQVNILQGVSKQVTSQKVDEYIEQMTLEEKVGQMFIVSPNVFARCSNVSSIEELNSVKVAKYNVGGYVIERENVLNPEQIAKFNSDLESLSEIPVLICVDESGGVSSLVATNKRFPEVPMKSFAEITPKDANGIGYVVGEYINEYGFNVNMSINSSIGINTEGMSSLYENYGGKPNELADLVTEIMRGLHSSGVLTCVNDFPTSGFGYTDLNANGFSKNYKKTEQLKSSELVPVIKLIDNEVDFVIVNHLVYPEAFHENVPSSLNYEVVTGLLRNNLGYEGVIVTDRLDAGAIIRNYTSEEVAIMAILAGNDIILMPNEIDKSFDAVIEAVGNGTISEARIDESVKRILMAKSKL